MLKSRETLEKSSPGHWLAVKRNVEQNIWKYWNLIGAKRNIKSLCLIGCEGEKEEGWRRKQLTRQRGLSSSQKDLQTCTQYFNFICISVWTRRKGGRKVLCQDSMIVLLLHIGTNLLPKSVKSVKITLTDAWWQYSCHKSIVTAKVLKLFSPVKNCSHNYRTITVYHAT